MMAAYQPQQGGMHPGMAPHGHPSMTPGQPMNPAQMQQMGHPGVSGPGQPHVTQAGPMMGMHPGANGMATPGGMGGQHPGGQMGGMPGQSMAGGAPNVQALNHLTPQAQMQQQHLLQQQQQQLAANPQLAMQHQRAMAQRQMAAQMQANGMGGMQQGGMQGMNPQQMQQLQQMQQNNPGMHPQAVQLTPQLQTQMQQMQLMRQQQQQQAQQNQQMQQQLAMQHTNSNQGGQPGPQNQQGAQGQHPGQVRPQSRMANQSEQNQTGAQQNTPQGTQAQQQQQGQPNQQQGQQQNLQQQGQQQPMNPQHMQAMRNRQMQIQMQQQQQNAAMQRQMAQVQQMSQAGQYILKLILMCDELSSFNSDNGQDYDAWKIFVDKHFAAEAQFLHTLSQDGGRQKTYKVPRSTIARYFQMYFDSGAQSIRLHPEHGKEDTRDPNRHRAFFASATFTVSYPNGARLEMTGTLDVLFATPSAELIQQMELVTWDSEEVVMRSEIERVLSNWSPTMPNKASPKMTKNKLPKAQQKLQSQLEGLTIDHFPKAHKGTSGITSRVQQFLEIGETMNVMTDLIHFAQDQKLRPEPAMEALVAQYQREGVANGDAQQANQHGNPQINLPANGVAMGNRTPSMQNMQIPNAQGQFSSPSVSHLGLPMQNGMPGMNGSPSMANNPGLAPNMNMPNSHTPSPHQSNMAAPAMMPQHSQQGTNSSAASANTSPNVSQQKRRRSTVKMEGDEAGGEGSQGANRVKPSPRMGKKGKPGGA